MSDCPICGSDEYDGIKRSCPECGHYDESFHHGSIARRRKAQEREIQRRKERGRL